jgi:hypothetical protein
MILAALWPSSHNWTIGELAVDKAATAFRHTYQALCLARQGCCPGRALTVRNKCCPARLSRRLLTDAHLTVASDQKYGPAVFK